MRDEMRRADRADEADVRRAARAAGVRLLGSCVSGSCLRLASWIACQMRAGVIGISRCLMPYSDSASITAFTTAGSPPEQPASPQPLAPSGLVLVGTGWLRHLDHRRVVRARHGVVHERAGQQLAVVVVDRLLQQRLADALHHAAMDLALDQQRIDDGAEIVDRGIFHHLRVRRSRDRLRPRRRDSRSGRRDGHRLGRHASTSSDVGTPSGSFSPARSLRASSMMPIERSVPAMTKRPALNSMSPADASSTCEAICLPCSITSSAASHDARCRRASSSASRRCRRRRPARRCRLAAGGCARTARRACRSAPAR